jgi:hypothetical protein
VLEREANTQHQVANVSPHLGARIKVPSATADGWGSELPQNKLGEKRRELRLPRDADLREHALERGPRRFLGDAKLRSRLARR